jgi:signal peptidase I
VNLSAEDPLDPDPSKHEHAGQNRAGYEPDARGDYGHEPESADRVLRSGARAFMDWVLVVGLALVVALVIRGFVLAHFVVDGTSMARTLASGDRVFVNKMSYRIGEPQRGDVVVLHQISGTSERDLIKRVIALGGEEIEIRSCEVRINGRILLEPYLDASTTSPGSCGGDTPRTLVPLDHVFVLGDNRGGSQDSRAIGPIQHEDLVGRAFVVFWPRSSWQWL